MGKRRQPEIGASRGVKETRYLRLDIIQVWVVPGAFRAWGRGGWWDGREFAYPTWGAPDPDSALERHMRAPPDEMGNPIVGLWGLGSVSWSGGTIPSLGHWC
jgi:hypothetical protein